MNNEVLCFQENSAQILETSFQFRISILFQYLSTFRQNSILFKGLGNQFWN